MIKSSEAKRGTIKVIELFAGVGGFRLGLEGYKGMSPSSGYTKHLKRDKVDYKVVWSNQWEPSSRIQHANDVYEKNWGNSSHNGNDLGEVETSDIPDHDLLVGGFPCQDYSVATTLKNSKGLIGRKGVLWWQIERILREKGKKAPKYLLLENVDRMLGSPASQRGRDFAVMLASLSDLGYAVEWRVINAADYGMPQRRRRVFFIGYKKGTKGYKKIQKDLDQYIFNGTLSKAFPITASNQNLEPNTLKGSLKTLSSKFNVKAKKTARSPFKKAGVMIDRTYYTLDPEVHYKGKSTFLGDILLPLKSVPKEFRISSKDIKNWEYQKGAKKIKRKSKATGHEYLFAEGKMSFPDSLDKPSRTIITGEGGAAPSRFKHVVRSGRVYRRLVPIELERLNMFPDNHTKYDGVTDTKRAFFMGNALVVGVIEKIGDKLF